MKEQYPELFQFLAGYFHQDWTCEHEAEDDVIRQFIADSTPETVSQVKSELQSVLRSIQGEENIQNFLFNQMGCSFYYPYAWPSGHAWLEHMLHML